VAILSGTDFAPIDSKNAPDPDGAYHFSLFPGRYVVVANGPAGALAAKPIQALGGPLDVIF
jgi:hypothetical protein